MSVTVADLLELPSLREAGEGVQEQYHALYQALYADPEELLSLWAEG